MNIEALTKELAYEACFDAEIEGFGVDSEDPEDVARFMPRARDRAVRYANILSEVK